VWRKGLVEDAVWKIWEVELKRTISSPLYIREWQKLRKEFESCPEFLSFVEQVQKDRPHMGERKTVDVPPSQ
jgi:hypothetical protein